MLKPNPNDLFEKCVVRHLRGGRQTIKCRLGLWEVEGPVGGRIESEASRYWSQYYSDGEYDTLLANAPSDSATSGETHSNAS